ncbi:uncharacterized protein LOC134819839 [Bolinopsis microptera]|uniref:uncharacterized protein LOC134819839 n=1 Tax=Bolinopsis microptera TaxID=2820187 RepID=UPI0030799A42
MPFKGKYNTDWQGLCVTDLEEPELDIKNLNESEGGDSLAPTDIVMSPSECSVSRSVINISLSDLSESVYIQHYDIGLVKEVQDAWQMPKCGTSPRTSPPPVELITLPRDLLPIHLPGDTLLKPSPLQMKSRRPSYHLPIQRSCVKKKSNVAVETVLSDLSLTSISGQSNF